MKFLKKLRTEFAKESLKDLTDTRASLIIITSLVSTMMVYGANDIDLEQTTIADYLNSTNMSNSESNNITSLNETMNEMLEYRSIYDVINQLEAEIDQVVEGSNQYNKEYRKNNYENEALAVSAALLPFMLTGYAVGNKNRLKRWARNGNLPSKY